MSDAPTVISQEVVGIHAEDLVVLFYRKIILAESGIDRSQIVIRIDKIRIQSDCFLKVCNCQVIQTEFSIGGSPVVISLGEKGSNPDDLIKVINSLLVFPLFAENSCQIIMGQKIVAGDGAGMSENREAVLPGCALFPCHC